MASSGDPRHIDVPPGSRVHGWDKRQNNGVNPAPTWSFPGLFADAIAHDDLAHMVEASVAAGFGPHKETTLPRWCRECEVLKACWGGCPKHRFTTSPHGEPGLHYLCAGYKKFFMHVRKYLRAMTTLLENGLPVSYVMEAVKGPLVIRRG